MQKYIALLRGINVGGKNKISMAELKVVFEEMGFAKVSTYINSGNIIFSCESIDETEIKIMCERVIEDKFKLRIPVAIISAGDLSKAMQNAPDWWDTYSEATHNAIFVMPPVTAEQVFEQVGAAKPEYEQVGSYGQVIFWSAPLRTFSKTRWSKITSTSVYNSVTMRNANTAKKLLQLVDANNKSGASYEN